LTTVSDSDEDPNYNAQLYLPASWSGEFTSGEQLPDGLVKLWDASSNSFLEGQTFYYSTQAQLQVDEAVTLSSVGTPISPDDGTQRYSVVVVGTDITRTLDQLRTRFHKHEHRGDDGTFPLDHKYLTGSARGVLTIEDVGGDPLDDLVVGFTQNSSTINFNDHPQYLHRAGQDTSQLKNALFGDLLLAPTKWEQSTDSIFHHNEDSYGIRFGDVDGPYIYGVDFGASDLGLYVTSPNSLYCYSDNRILNFTPGDVTLWSIGDNVNLLAGDGINLTHGRVDPGVKIDSSDASYDGRLLVSGVNHDTEIVGGTVTAEQGFVGKAAGTAIAPYLYEGNESLGSMPDWGNIDFSTLLPSTYNVVGWTLMVRRISDDNWFDGQKVTGETNYEYYGWWNSDTRYFLIRFNGSHWDSQTVRVKIVLWYKLA